MSQPSDEAVQPSDASRKSAGKTRPLSAELQSRVCVGDMEALSRLLMRTEARLKRYILKYMTSAHDTEDVLSDVWSEALMITAKNPQLLPATEEEMLPWLHRVAHNKCIDRLRRAEHKANVASLDTVEGRLIVDDYTARKGMDRVVEEAAIANVDKNTVQQSHEDLLEILLCQPLTRLILFLEVLEYHENNEQYGVYQEMARHYGLTSATIANHISQMRKELRAKQVTDLLVGQTVTMQVLRITIYRAINQKLNPTATTSKRGRPRRTTLPV